MSGLPVLYSFRRCPYAMRARIALVYAGVQVRLREILLREKPREMLMISPKGTVPVMQLADGTVLEESLDIMRYALVQHDPEHWWPDQLKQQQLINQLIQQNDDFFKQHLDRYKYPNKYLDKPLGHDNTAQQHCIKFCESLELQLAQHRYLISDHRSLADAALFPFVRQFSKVDEAWFRQLPMPNLNAWLDEWLSSDLFIMAMKKFPQWSGNDNDETECIFPS